MLRDEMITILSGLLVGNNRIKTMTNYDSNPF